MLASGGHLHSGLLGVSRDETVTLVSASRRYHRPCNLCAISERDSAFERRGRGPGDRRNRYVVAVGLKPIALMIGETALLARLVLLFIGMLG